MYAAGDEWLFGGSGVVFHQTIYIFWRQAHPNKDISESIRI